MTATMEQAKARWIEHTSQIVFRPFGRAVWTMEKGNPTVSGDRWRMTYKRDARGVWAEASLIHHPTTGEVR